MPLIKIFLKRLKVLIMILEDPQVLLRNLNKLNEFNIILRFKIRKFIKYINKKNTKMNKTIYLFIII